MTSTSSRAFPVGNLVDHTPEILQMAREPVSGLSAEQLRTLCRVRGVRFDDCATDEALRTRVSDTSHLGLPPRSLLHLPRDVLSHLCGLLPDTRSRVELAIVHPLLHDLCWRNQLIMERKKKHLEPSSFFWEGAALGPENVFPADYPGALMITPLVAAVHYNLPAVCRLLLRGAGKKQLNQISHRGHAPLWIAAYAGFEECLAALIEAGADLDARKRTLGIRPMGLGATPIIAAANQGHLRCVQMLMAAGADVDAQTERGSSAIYCAIQGHHQAVADALVQYGADPSLSRRDGALPISDLMFAGYGSVGKRPDLDLKLFKQFLSRGIRAPQATNLLGRLATSTFAFPEISDETVNALLDAGAIPAGDAVYFIIKRLELKPETKLRLFSALHQDGVDVFHRKLAKERRVVQMRQEKMMMKLKVTERAIEKLKAELEALPSKAIDDPAEAAALRDKVDAKRQAMEQSAAQICIGIAREVFDSSPFESILSNSQSPLSSAADSSAAAAHPYSDSDSD